jgi:mono/diheme cytochrome c family protein
MRSAQKRSPAILGAVAVASAMSLAYAQSPRQRRPAAAASSQEVKRGQYLTTVAGCNDCHTPFKMGERGPEPDMTRMLSGHPQDLRVPSPPALNEAWPAAASATFTAWAGPWGVSFTSNLTPDKETGLGQWTEEKFITALRTGKHEGNGRDILPPMPWQMIGQMTDDDLKAIFAYLRTIPPVKNKVPQPLPPTAVGGSGPGQQE